MKSLNKDQQTMVAVIICDCIRLGISVKLINKRYVISNDQACGGYFCSQDKELAVAIGVKMWFSALLHEYYHMKQWQEGFKYYTGDHPYKVLNEWYRGSDQYTEKDAHNATYAVICNELDCEQRTLCLLYRCPELEVDPIWHIKKTNCSMYFRVLATEKRKWLAAGKSPLEPMELVPDHLLYPEEYWNIPANIRTVLENCFESSDSV
jgi:hypothetical protein